MGGHDDGAPAGEQDGLDGAAEDVAGHGPVEGGQRVVQDERLGRRVDGTGQGDARALAARYVAPVGRHQRGVAVRHRLQVVEQRARLQHLRSPRSSLQ